MARTGFDTWQKPGQMHVPKQAMQKPKHFSTKSAQIDPGLAAVIAAWANPSRHLGDDAKLGRLGEPS